MITAEYLLGHMNVILNWESRNLQDKSKWKLLPTVFRDIFQKCGTPATDLFPSRTSHQIPAYFVWKPDSTSKATGAPQQRWVNIYFHTFPRFRLIEWVLQKLRKKNVTAILISHHGKLDAWYSMLLYMPVRKPLLIPQTRKLLTDPFGKIYPLIQNQTLTLAAWKVSGKVWQYKAFQRGYPDLSQVFKEQTQFLLMNRPGVSGLACILKGKSIHFDVL